MISKASNLESATDIKESFSFSKVIVFLSLIKKSLKFLYSLFLYWDKSIEYFFINLSILCLDNPDLITDGTYYFASEFDNNVPKNKLKTFENEFEKKFLDNNFAKDILDTDFFRVFKDHK